MTSTQWCDVSEFQRVVDDSYPYRWLAFRSNDGTYRDRAFSENYAWCMSAITRGRLDGFIVYAVYEPDGGRWVDTLMSMVGTPHPRMVVMIDVESWGGRISGDHSADINAGRARIAAWLGSSSRVIGYGNGGDLRNLWPNRGDAKIVLAAYGSNPSFPGKIAHQYTSTGNVPPFGYPVDVNSADGYSSAQLMTVFGLGPSLASVGGSAPVQTLTPEEDDIMRFLYCKDNVGDLWTLLNTSNGVTKQTRVQDEANLWAQAFGTAHVLPTASFLAVVKAVQATIPVAVAATVQNTTPTVDNAAIAAAVADEIEKRMAK